MESVLDEKLRYPIGRFELDREVTPEKRKRWIRQIAVLPERLGQALQVVSKEKLDTPYRPGGWTVRQVVHHLADSHVNAYVRFRLALTEDAPAIKTYDQEKWAGLHDAVHAPVEASLQLLQGLHVRWIALLEQLPESAFGRVIEHPEWGRVPLDMQLQLYAWHSKHHVAHILRLAE